MADPVLPEYDGACLSRVVPAVLERDGPAPVWLPEPVVHAEQTVLLTVDGLGWEQLQERRDLVPTMATMAGGPITTVVPSTTATALTSLTTGTVPAVHGVVGYRMRVGRNHVLNVLRWRTEEGDARLTIPPGELQVLEPFAGTRPPVVTRAEFTETGFTGAHLAGVRMHGWRMSSTLPVAVGALLRAGEPFVYAYYDGIDKVAHEHGFGAAYDAEVRAADRLVADLYDVLPAGAALVVASDHGQVDVSERIVAIDAEVMGLTTLLSGEGRFRWLHARPGMAGRLADAAERCHGEQAWVRPLPAAVEENWFGGAVDERVAARFGDVVLAPFEPVAFLDPADTGEVRMRCRHGSLTPAEMLVPLLAARA